jgi:hypothetical protein
VTTLEGGDGDDVVAVAVAAGADAADVAARWKFGNDVESAVLKNLGYSHIYEPVSALMGCLCYAHSSPDVTSRAIQRCPTLGHHAPLAFFLIEKDLAVAVEVTHNSSHGPSQDAVVFFDDGSVVVATLCRVMSLLQTCPSL